MEKRRLYRAIGHAERADIVRTGLLRPGENSCEGKHFATSLLHAEAWGQRMHESDFWVIMVEADLAGDGDWVHWPILDGIGEAYFVPETELSRCPIVSGFERFVRKI